MRKYEVMFIVKPDLEEAVIKNTAESMKKLLVENGATITFDKSLGQRELAYEINKYKTGYYFLFIIECEDSKAIEEFDRVSHINEDIIRSLIIKKEA